MSGEYYRMWQRHDVKQSESSRTSVTIETQCRSVGNWHRLLTSGYGGSQSNDAWTAPVAQLWVEKQPKMSSSGYIKRNVLMILEEHLSTS